MGAFSPIVKTAVQQTTDYFLQKSVFESFTVVCWN